MLVAVPLVLDPMSPAVLEPPAPGLMALGCVVAPCSVAPALALPAAGVLAPMGPLAGPDRPAVSGGIELLAPVGRGATPGALVPELPEGPLMPVLAPAPVEPVPPGCVVGALLSHPVTNAIVPTASVAAAKNLIPLVRMLGSLVL